MKLDLSLNVGSHSDSLGDTTGLLKEPVDDDTRLVKEQSQNSPNKGSYIITLDPYSPIAKIRMVPTKRSGILLPVYSTFDNMYEMKYKILAEARQNM